MNSNMLFETLKKLIDRERERKEPSYIYLDEKDNQVREIPLSKMDSAAAAYISNTMKQYNAAKIIHDSVFGKY